MKSLSLSILAVATVIVLALLLYFIKIEKFDLPSVTRRFVPHPSATKYFPLHTDDPYEELRINSGICMTEDGKLSAPCNDVASSFACRGPRRDVNGNIVVCEYKTPMLADNFLDTQKCVTKIPGNIKAGFNNVYYSEEDLEPEICSTALLSNPNNRLNIVEMLDLVQISPGSGYPNVSNALFQTTTHNKGVGLEMLVDIQNGGVTKWYISHMGYGYKVGDTITLSNGRNDAVWKVISVNVFPAVLPINGKNITIPDQGEHPRDVIKYLYNPYNLDRKESDIAFKNACTAVCTNEIDRCYSNCFSASVEK
jgi:hypothetical protein